jgi:hypothetical protein
VALFFSNHFNVLLDNRRAVYKIYRAPTADRESTAGTSQTATTGGSPNEPSRHICEIASLRIRPPAPFNQEDGMTHLSRRSLVAGAAALPALAVPAVAEADPTFAVIEAHRNALLDAMRSLKFLNEMYSTDPRCPNAWAKNLAADHAEEIAQFELSSVVPTTIDGVFALMEYIEGLHTAKVGLPEDAVYYASVDDGDGYDPWIRRFEVDDLRSPHSGTPFQLPLIFLVMQNIRTALQSLSAVQS